MTIMDLAKLGIQSQDLTHLVNEVASSIACKINFSGVEHQAQFLYIMGSMSFLDILTRALTSALRPGVVVELINFEHWNLNQPGPFKGRVVSFEPTKGSLCVEVPGEEDIFEFSINDLVRVHES